MKNKQLLIGTLIFATTVAAGYFVKRRVDVIRKELVEEGPNRDLFCSCKKQRVLWRERIKLRRI